VRAEVNRSGAVTGSWRYRAYGEINQTSGQVTPSILGYAGQLIDPSGLYYMRARWYDAASGRWLSRDPLGGSSTSAPSLNAYGYAAGNPANLFDPSGLEAESMLDPGTGGCAGSCQSSLKEGLLGCGGVLWCHLDTNTYAVTTPLQRLTVCALILRGCAVLFSQRNGPESVEGAENEGPSIGPEVTSVSTHSGEFGKIVATS
jgi:RHS repeat-associated protein